MWFDGVSVEDAQRIAYPDQLYPVFWRNTDGRKWVKRGEIIGYFDETFAAAVGLWKRWKLFGLPHGTGWLHERESVVEIISVVEEEKNFYESRKLEEARKKRGN